LDSTFREIRGRDLFVQSIIPELYELYPGKISFVDRFLRTKVRSETLSKQDRDLLHNLILGVLRDNESAVIKTLLIFFTDLEGYLRKNLGRSVERYSSRPIRQLYEDAKIPKDTKHVSLGNLLTLYILAFRDSTAGDALPRIHPEALAHLRNLAAHSAEELLRGWENLFETLVKDLPGVRYLIRVIERITGSGIISAYH